MSHDWKPLLCAVAAGAATIGAVSLATSAVSARRGTMQSRSAVEDTLRCKLPADMTTWRTACEAREQDDAKWEPLRGRFRERGYTLWSPSQHASLRAPEGTEISANGFGYVTSQRGFGAYYNFDRWEYSNPLCRAARTHQGRDVIVRVVKIGSGGQNHLTILRRIARGRLSLFSENYTLPVLDEIVFHDITFCVFPKVNFTLDMAYGLWPRNSAGDVLNMIMQALEGLAFLHEKRIAHQDAFKSNFMVEWMPEPLRSSETQASRPRVYIIDLETAVEFPEDCPTDECRCNWLLIPIGIQSRDYMRPVPPEILSEQPYDPFKLDVWQLGTSFSDFKVCRHHILPILERLIRGVLKMTIPAIDEILGTMTAPVPSSRRGASELLRLLGEVVSSLPPSALQIKPSFPPLPFEMTET